LVKRQRLVVVIKERKKKREREKESGREGGRDKEGRINLIA
jgi:hypothetical protein